MDLETVAAEDFGASLRGIGLNLLVRDVPVQCAFLREVFGMTAHQVTSDFAIVTYGKQVFQLHSDGTYHSNPLLGLLPETPPRGAGIEIRLYDSDPDQAAARAQEAGELRRDVKIVPLRQFVLGALNWTVEWFDTNRYSVDELADRAAKLVLEGIQSRSR